MAQSIKTGICVIGAGSGGLSVAYAASQMGVDTVLVERGKMGGDCLNYGCVPSKSLIAAGHAADTVRRARQFGVNGHEPPVEFSEVHEHVHGVIAAIAPNDSVERFTGLGVRVIEAPGRFTGPRSLQAGDIEVTARRFVIATGSSAAVPPIPGLKDVPYLTNESVFELRERPEHLIVVGGGPIGMELAQAHRRLGSRVTVLEQASILPKDDPELVAVIRRNAEADGVDLRENTRVVSVEQRGNGIAALIEPVAGEGGEPTRIEGSDLLVAAGRQANVSGLDLEAAGIAYSPKGITVDERLRTSNRTVFAIGDVAGSYQFTHAANYHAGIVIKNALFRFPAKVNYDALPWVTFTDPELAQVGLTEAQARAVYGDAIRVLRWSFHENDRAQAERRTDGQVKIITRRNGRIIGAGIAGPSAGELIQVWVLAIAQKLKIGALATMIAPYPTLGEVNKRAAGSFFTPTVFGDRTKRLVRFLARFG